MHDLKTATITTLEVAEMMEVEHYKILRKLEGDKNRKGYISILTDSQMGVSDYFIPSTYRDTSGKENKCYEVTKLGCDFLANKFTGEKGIVFTARYVKRFHEMEDVIKKPLSALEQLQLMQQATLEVSDKVDSINEDLQDFKQTLPLLAVECDRITNAVKHRGTQFLGGKQSNAYLDKSLRGRVYADIHGQVKRQFGVSTYKAIRRNQCDKAVQFINSYEIPFVLQDEIKDVNAQMNFSESEDL